MPATDKLAKLKEQADARRDSVSQRYAHLAEVKSLLDQLADYQDELESQNAKLRRAQSKINQHAAFESRLFDEAPVGYLILDKSLRIVRCNAEARRVYLAEDASLEGIFLSSLYPKGFERREIVRWLASKADKKLELQKTEEDGCWHHLNKTSIEGNQTLITITDITDRVRAEHSALALADSYRAVLDSSPDTILEVSASGVILTANKAVETLTGYAIDELIGKKVESLIPVRMRPGHAAKRNGFISEKQSRSMMANANRKVTLLHKSGEEVPIEINLSSFAEGEDRRVTAVIRDVSPRLLLEEKTREAQQAGLHYLRSLSSLEDTVKSQERLFAIVSHELRTPASKMKMLIDEIQGTETDKAMLEESAAVAEHMLDVIDDMRAGSQVDLFTEDQSGAHFNLDDTLRYTLSVLNRMADDKGIELVFHSDVVDLPMVIGPRKNIRQVVLNLVKNALVHSEGRHVKVLASTLSRTDSESTLEIVVTDDGRGIAESMQQKIFEPYERDSKSTGSGLGLHLVKSVVDTLPRASISLESSAGEGACFRLEMTLKHADSETEMDRLRQETLGVALKDKRILLVEDTPTLRMLGKTLLERKGAKVYDAFNGIEALEVMDRVQSIDLVLTDIMMPEMDGYELTEELRQRGYKGLIIGITAATVGDESAELLRRGASAVLPKPLSIDAISELVIASDFK